VVDGYLKLMNNIEKYKGEAFNFSTGYNYSVLEMVEKIGAIIGKKVNFKIINNQKNEIPEQSLNYDKAEKLLNWKSAFTFEEGIKETLEWYKKYFNSWS
jgi:CDP-glucose 4,6-dehydratase